MSYRRPLAFALALTALAAPLAANAATKNVYFAGNSLTDHLLYGRVEGLAQSRGHTQRTGVQLIWGTPMEYLWNQGQPVDTFKGDGTRGQDGVYGQPPGGTLAPWQIEEELRGGYSKIVNSIPGLPERPRFWEAATQVKLDVLTIQAYDRDIHSDFQHASNFVNLLKANPANLNAQGKVTTKVVLFTHYSPRQQLQSGGQTVGVETGFDFTQRWTNRDNDNNPDNDYTGQNSTFTTRDYQNDLIKALTDPSWLGKTAPGSNQPFSLSNTTWGPERKNALTVSHPTSVLAENVRLVPVGDLLAEVEKRMRAEAALTSIAAVEAKYGLWNTSDLNPNDNLIYNNLGDNNFAEHLFVDGIHFNQLGHHLQSVAFFVAMYGEDPRGLPFLHQDNLTADADYVAFSQNVVWDVMTSNPYTGVPEPASAALLALGGLMLTRRRPA